MNVLSYDLDEGQVKEVKRFIRRLTEQEPAPYAKCPYYDRCENQICPMDSLKHKPIWYADEGLCLNPEYKNDRSVVAQKKLAKKKPSGYFTYGMLNRDIVIRRGITGIEPDIRESEERKGQNAIDSLYAERERAWITDHPEITPEQREKLRANSIKGLEAIRRHGNGESE